jgi:outer membrane protein assembly factor BamA
MASLGVRIQHDTRDTTFAPLEGSLLDLRADFYSDLFGSDLDFERYPATYSYYLNVRKDDVLAVDVDLCDVEGRVPFFALCLLGQGTSFRGYTGGRYRDRTLFTAQSEYRWQVRPRWGVVGFAGFGQVAPSFSEFTSGNWLPSGGVGVRWMASKDNRINLSVDYAWGSGESALYIYVGEAF